MAFSRRVCHAVFFSFRKQKQKERERDQKDHTKKNSSSERKTALLHLSAPAPPTTSHGQSKKKKGEENTNSANKKNSNSIYREKAARETLARHHTIQLPLSNTTTRTPTDTLYLLVSVFNGPYCGFHLSYSLSSSTPDSGKEEKKRKEGRGRIRSPVSHHTYTHAPHMLWALTPRFLFLSLFYQKPASCQGRKLDGSKLRGLVASCEDHGSSAMVFSIIFVTRSTVSRPARRS